VVLESPGNAHKKVLESYGKPLSVFCMHPVAAAVACRLLVMQFACKHLTSFLAEVEWFIITVHPVNPVTLCHQWSVAAGIVPVVNSYLLKLITAQTIMTLLLCFGVLACRIVHCWQH